MVSLQPEVEPAGCGPRSFRPNHFIRQVRSATGWNSPLPPHQSLPKERRERSGLRRQGSADPAARLANHGDRYVKDSVNLFSWRALSTTRGNEVISSDAY